MNKKILITGASGYVGSKIYQYLKEEGFEVTGTYNTNKLSDDLVKTDLTKEEEVKELILENDFNIIVHTVADAHTNTCEENPDYAYKINVESTKHIVKFAKEKDIRVIHLSTFACFNDSPTKVYPKTKLEAEKLIEQLNNYVILRLSIVVGLSPNQESKNYYNDLVMAYKTKQEFEADSSWEFEMSYLGNVSKLITQIIEKEDINRVMIPYVDEGVTSRYKIAKDLGLNVIETTSNRIIPLPELDLSLYEKYDLYKGNYEDAIKLMKEKLNSL